MNREKIIDGTAMIQRVKELYESGKVDLPYYNIVKEAVQMEPALQTNKEGIPLEKKRYTREAYVKAQDFLRTLKDNRPKLTRQQFSTLRGQALSGDVEGAYTGFNRLMLERMDEDV